MSPRQLAPGNHPTRSTAEFQAWTLTLALQGDADSRRARVRRPPVGCARRPVRLLRRRTASAGAQECILDWAAAHGAAAPERRIARLGARSTSSKTSSRWPGWAHLRCWAADPPQAPRCLPPIRVSECTSRLRAPADFARLVRRKRSKVNPATCVEAARRFTGSSTKARRPRSCHGRFTLLPYGRAIALVLTDPGWLRGHGDCAEALRTPAFADDRLR